jgi:hypothetical protein
MEKSYHPGIARTTSCFAAHHGGKAAVRRHPNKARMMRRALFLPMANLCLTHEIFFISTKISQILKTTITYVQLMKKKLVWMLR